MYEDFNLFQPKVTIFYFSQYKTLILCCQINHPIHAFIRELNNTATSKRRVSNIQFLLNPSSPQKLQGSITNQLPLSRLSSPFDPVSFESPNLAGHGGDQISTLATQRVQSPSVSILSQAPSLPAHQLKSETSPFCFQTPSPKLHVREVINLVSPVIVNQQSSLCLRTPSPNLKLHVTEVIDLVSPVDVLQQSSFTINLVTPPPKLKHLKVEPFSPKRDTSIEIFEHPLIVCSEEKPTITNLLTAVHACESKRFPTLDAAILAVCDEEETLGHKWVKGQTKKRGGEVRRITIRCNHYRFPTEQHSVAIDPANHRRGRSSKTGCKAHVNII